MKKEIYLTRIGALVLDPGILNAKQKASSIQGRKKKIMIIAYSED